MSESKTIPVTISFDPRKVVGRLEIRPDLLPRVQFHNGKILPNFGFEMSFMYDEETGDAELVGVAIVPRKSGTESFSTETMRQIEWLRQEWGHDDVLWRCVDRVYGSLNSG